VQVLTTEEEVLETIRSHFERGFPKTCRVCDCHYESYKEYLQSTETLGEPHSYDVENGDWNPLDPLGTFVFSDCRCGNTLTVGTSGMDLLTLWKLMFWARLEKARRKVPLGCLLNDLRTKLCKQVLVDAGG